MELYLKNANDNTGTIITKLIKEHDLRVDVKYPETSSTLKGTMYELTRLCILNILIVCLILKMYQLKVNMSENDVYLLINIFRDRYILMFTTIVDSGILSISQFLKITQFIIPFAFTFLYQIIRTGASIKLPNAFMISLIPAVSAILLDRQQEFTTKLVEFGLDPQANAKHRMTDFMASLCGFKSSSQILVEGAKNLLLSAMAGLVILQVKTGHDFIKQGTSLIQISRGAQGLSLNADAKRLLNAPQ